MKVHRVRAPSRAERAHDDYARVCVARLKELLDKRAAFPLVGKCEINEEKLFFYKIAQARISFGSYSSQAG